MIKKCTFCLGAILILTSAGFAAIGQTPSLCTSGLVASGHRATVGHCQMAHSYYYRSAVGLQQQTCIVGCQYQVIRRFCWWPPQPPCTTPHKPPCTTPHKPPCTTPHKPPCTTPHKPPCKPPASQPCIVEGGDASATAVSYGGGVDPTAQAVGGDASVVTHSRSLYNQPYIVKGGDASATAVSYGGGEAIAHAVGGDAMVVIK